MKDPRAELNPDGTHMSSGRTKAVLITIDQCFSGSNAGVQATVVA
jgi:hypothetical protein